MKKKCMPQKQPKQYDRPSICNCQKIFNPEKLFHDNTHDIAKTFVEILVLSGIHRCKATGAKDILLDAFHHYDAIRHGDIHQSKTNSLKKESVILCLATKCMMTCVEAYFTYSIMKQLLKAFFISIPECGIRNYIMESQSIYDQQSAWDHVARRTIQIFSAYGYILCPTVKDYNAEIKRVHQKLFNRMKNRVDPIEIPEYNCRESTKRVIKREQNNKEYVEFDVQKSPSKTSCSLVPKPCLQPCFSELTEVDKTKSVEDSKPFKRPIHVPKNTDYPFDNFPRCLKCNFPKQLCNCNVDPRTGKLHLKSSQGPFRCEWYRMDKAYRVKSKDHNCPIDCWDFESTFSGDECIYEEQSANYSIDITESELVSDSELPDLSEQRSENVCSEEAESEIEEPEPFMEGYEYCCHMPECNLEPEMFTDKPPYIPEPTEIIGKLNFHTPKKSPGKNRPDRGTDGKNINKPHDKTIGSTANKEGHKRPSKFNKPIGPDAKKEVPKKPRQSSDKPIEIDANKEGSFKPKNPSDKFVGTGADKEGSKISEKTDKPIRADGSKESAKTPGKSSDKPVQIVASKEGANMPGKTTDKPAGTDASKEGAKIPGKTTDKPGASKDGVKIPIESSNNTKPDTESIKTNAEKEKITEKEKDQEPKKETTVEKQSEKQAEKQTEKQSDKKQNRQTDIKKPDGQETDNQKPDEPGEQRPDGQKTGNQKYDGQNPDDQKINNLDQHGQKKGNKEPSRKEETKQNIGNQEAQKLNQKEQGDKGTGGKNIGKKIPDSHKIIGERETHDTMKERVPKNIPRQDKTTSRKNNHKKTGTKKRLPCCKCTFKKTAKRNKCLICKKSVQIQRNRVLSSASFC